MKAINYFFFYGYIAVIIAAGLWGAYVNPSLDFRVLMDVDVDSLPEYSRINMLSQYRFLRAIESGFGFFSVLFVREIFTIRKFNRLFLTIMLLGVFARMVSLATDGQPNGAMLFFMGFELIGVIVIWKYSRKTILQ